MSLYHITLKFLFLTKDSCYSASNVDEDKSEKLKFFCTNQVHFEKGVCGTTNRSQDEGEGWTIFALFSAAEFSRIPFRARVSGSARQIYGSILLQRA
jgi:hypothetical protein